MKIVDPDIGAAQDPPLQWQLREGLQYEIWPPPATDGTLIRIKGIKTIAPLVADGDLAEIDDQLIILFSAAEALTRGATSTTVHAIPGGGASAGKGPEDLIGEGELLLHPLRRTI